MKWESSLSPRVCLTALLDFILTVQETYHADVCVCAHTHLKEFFCAEMFLKTFIFQIYPWYFLRHNLKHLKEQIYDILKTIFALPLSHVVNVDLTAVFCSYVKKYFKYVLFNTYSSYYLVSSVFYSLIYVDMAALKWEKTWKEFLQGSCAQKWPCRISSIRQSLIITADKWL